MIYKINIVSPYSITQNYTISFNLIGNIYENRTNCLAQILPSNAILLFCTCNGIYKNICLKPIFSTLSTSNYSNSHFSMFRKHITQSIYLWKQYQQLAYNHMCCTFPQPMYTPGYQNYPQNHALITSSNLETTFFLILYYKLLITDIISITILILWLTP